MKKGNKFIAQWQAAEWLNQNLLAPSDCFEFYGLDSIEAVLYIHTPINCQIREILGFKVSNDFPVICEVASEKEIREFDYSDNPLIKNMKGKRLLVIGDQKLMEQYLLQNFQITQAKVSFLRSDLFLSNENEPCLITPEDDFVKIGKKLKNFSYVVSYDDDMVSAAEAALLMAKLNKLYGACGPNGDLRRMVCVGGKGPASKFMYRKSEGEKQKEVAMRLGVAEDLIIVADKGTNTGYNLQELYKIIGKSPAVVAVTQRLSMILKYSQDFQRPELNLSYYTIYQSLEESCHWYNAMALHGKRPILHFWAHFVSRCKRYNGTYMSSIPGFTSDEEKVKPFAEKSQLLKKYVIKQPGHTFKTISQYIPILWDLYRKKKPGLVDQDIESLIKSYQEKINGVLN